MAPSADFAARYQRLGDPKTLTADVRFLCATNRPLENLRGDFAARHQHRLIVPSLDDRREDIPLIARALVLKAAAANPDAAARFVTTDGRRPEAKLDPDFVAHLVSRDYTANVRELDIVLRAAMSASRDGVLRMTPDMQARPKLAATHAPPSEDEIRAALERHRGNMTRAASSLGITRFALIRLQKKYGLRAA